MTLPPPHALTIIAAVTLAYAAVVYLVAVGLKAADDWLLRLRHGRRLRRLLNRGAF